MIEPVRKQDNTKRPVNGAGAGIALGAGFGAAMMAVTGDAWWLGVSIALGLVFGSAIGRKGENDDRG